jgi:quinohemoprotein ethanol dehydrogenase
MRRPAEEGPEPPSHGFLLAWDPATQTQRWRVVIPNSRINGGTLSTAGNLVFSGVAGGLIRAHSADKGAQLWEAKIGSGVGTPVTYMLDGRQYVTMVGGAGTAENPGRVWTFALDNAGSQ